MSVTTINRFEAPTGRLDYEVVKDTVTQVPGRDMNTLLSIGGVDIELSPANAKALLDQLKDNAPRECAVCFGHRFTDGARTIECTWCNGTGYTR